MLACLLAYMRGGVTNVTLVQYHEKLEGDEKREEIFTRISSAAYTLD